MHREATFPVLLLAAKGVPALVIEGRQLGGGQTSHAHGWLHQGYVFADAHEGEVAMLRRGAAWWRDRVSSLAEPLATTAVIAASSHRTARELAERWTRVGLPVERAEGLSQRLPYAFATPEHSVSPVGAVRAVVDSGPELHFVRARALSLRAKGPDGEASVVVDRDGRQFLLSARAVVIAAGAGIASILQTSPGNSAVTLRRTHMIVVRSEVPVPDALAIPEQAARGLFSVCRSAPSGRSKFILAS